jgi:predicted nuclease with TOPRIM domain
LYREFATLTLKVNAQEKEIESLEDRVNTLVVQNQRLLNDLEEHNKNRGNENALLLERVKDLEYKFEVLSMKNTLSSGKVFNDRFEFTDKQVNRVGNYETKGQVLVAWKDDYLATKKVNVNTIGEINVIPKIKKLDKDKFISYIDESYLGGITIRGQGEIQQIEPPRNQFSFGPFIGVAYNGATGLTEPIVGVGISYNLIKIWDWR